MKNPYSGRDLNPRLSSAQWAIAVLVMMALVAVIVVVTAGPSKAATQSVTGGYSTASQPTARRGDGCDRLIRRDTMTKSDNTLGRDKWTINWLVNYDYCYPTGPNYSVPRSETVSYNFEGDSMGCAWYNRNMVNMVANPYFWSSQTGENFNPSGIELPCDSSSSHTESRIFHDPPRIHTRVVDKIPRHAWGKLNWEVNRPGPEFQDPDGVLYVALRPCSGAGTANC